MGCHCEEQGDEAISLKNEIAAPFGLAKTGRKVIAIRTLVDKLFFYIVSLNFLLQQSYKEPTYILNPMVTFNRG
jgi:hypothetical protein